MSYYPDNQKFSLILGDREIIVETGKLAQQCNGSAVVTVGGTTILATATMSATIREGIDFFPLTVNYNEKYYAAGVIRHSPYQKRENRPSDDKILMGRVIDRTIRPLFPKGFQNDVQVMVTTLSYDRENEHDMISAVAASVALSISDIPWAGPSASVRVGLINGELVLNPTFQAREKSDLDLIVSASPENVIMIEAGANEVPEEEMLKAIDFGKKWAQKICKFIAEIQEKIGKKKIVFTPPEDDKELIEWIAKEGMDDLRACLFGIPGKKDRSDKKAEILEKLKGNAAEKFGEERDMTKFMDYGLKVWKKLIRDSILTQEKRIAERKLTEIRSLNCEVGLFQRTHGSALFQRGETQAVSIVTLGPPSMALNTDGIEGERKQYYFHHYNFPPYATGEVSNRLNTGNREIGHGMLAQRAILPVLPDRETFPYVVRVVTEILGSNGSSSMASTCGSTLSLMDAGVPIKKPVAGIAMGLMVDPENTDTFKVLSDIQDEEDFGGDMDFKVAGTKDGITAIQMDIKVLSISEAIFTQALGQAKTGRLEILKAMESAISEPRKELSSYAPRLITIHIKPEKIREVIGKGGEMIQKIIAATGCTIDIEQDGSVIISSVDGDSMQKAVDWIKSIVEEGEIGKEYTAEVVRVEPYGAFAEILPGTQGLIHVSNIIRERVENINDYLKVGQKVRVKLISIDEKGRLALSMKDASQSPKEE